MAQYGESNYWEDRYAKEPEPFDWYQSYGALKPLLKEYLRPEHFILNAGCGNSTFSEELYEDGYGGNPLHGSTGCIVNIDISRTVITSMTEKYKDKVGMTWQVMNVCALSFPDSYFNFVFDKGTLDSILCGDNSTANANRYLSEVSRVLQPGGVLFVVTFGPPENRLVYLELEQYGWRVTLHTILKPNIIAAGGPENSTDPSQVHYVYVCKKKD